MNKSINTYYSYGDLLLSPWREPCRQGSTDLGSFTHCASHAKHLSVVLKAEWFDCMLTFLSFLLSFYLTQCSPNCSLP